MRLLLILALFPFSISGQVVNDDIYQALRLEIGQPLSSTTAYSTIQSECVNYSLTKSCIKYHNDQWFIINSGSYDHLYINVEDQECRELLGVQLVVLKGEPCDTEDYELLRCVSFSSNDDFYVRIDSLERHTDYLINIDGYLHDFCSFELVLDTIPHGMPDQINLDLKTIASNDSSLIQMQWEAEDSLLESTSHFEIWKRDETQFKHYLKRRIPVIRNAYGIYGSIYSFSDTITSNILYYYKILAIDKAGRKHLFDERQFRGMNISAPVKIEIRLAYRTGTPISLSISDKDSGIIYRKVRFSFDPEKHRLLEYPVISLVEKGVKTLLVEVVDERTGNLKKMEYNLQ